MNHDKPITNRGKIRRKSSGVKFRTERFEMALIKQVDIAYRRFCDKRGLKYWDCEGAI